MPFQFILTQPPKLETTKKLFLKKSTAKVELEKQTEKSNKNL